METAWVRLEKIIDGALKNPDPVDGMRSVADGARDLTGAEVALLYLIQLDQARFLPVVGSPDQVADAPAFVSPNVARWNEASGLFFEVAVRQASPTSRKAETENGAIVTQTAVPIMRQSSCIGILVLQRSGDTPPSAANEKPLLGVLAHIIAALAEKQSSLLLLKALQQPIDFHQPLKEYLQELLLVIATASNMPMITIRLLDKDAGALRCIAAYGFVDDLSLFDLEPYHDFAPSKIAVDSRIVVAKTDVGKPSASLSDILDKSQSRDVRSFLVAPMVSGGEVLGTLTLAAQTSFSSSSIEIAELELIANMVGNSIANFRNAQAVSSLFQQDAELSIGLAALEVAQAVRHEVRSIVESINVELANLKFAIGRPVQTAGHLNAGISRIYENTQDLILVMDKIKLISQPPRPTLTRASLRSLINEAIALVSAKIDHDRVSVRLNGPDTEITVFSDRMRHAFLNLFLNSLDAFSLVKKRSDRSIVIEWRIRHSGAEVEIRYSDNGSGVDLAQLVIPEGHIASEIKADVIFEPGVTSKQSGSGYGLFLVRRIIEENRGSIELLDHREGVSFEIVLPTSIDSTLDDLSEAHL